ncbi:hypothetical protein J0910_07065 [Nocardiopsis sp. CNT-189]|uniref:TcpE family conjugal transfer membrane protein n=1 Tax=Nocardiopsis oceanisediminis TaxID=2816862 RepID=UPI003B2BD72F
MDLPTYTNIWRIEKRLYKLYDFRLPQPLSVVTLGVFLGVLAIWAMLLRLVGFPLETPWHVVWIVPPFVITFLATRPVIEGKRLTELLASQLRFLAEARVYTRLSPEHEPAEVRVVVTVWHRDPAAGPLPAVTRTRIVRPRKRARAVEEERTGTRPGAAAPPLSAPESRRPAAGPEPLALPGADRTGPARGEPAPPPLRLASAPAEAAPRPQREAEPAPAQEPEPLPEAPEPPPLAEAGAEAPAAGAQAAPDPGEEPGEERSEPALRHRPARPRPERGGPAGDRRGIGTRMLNYFGFGLNRSKERSPSPEEEAEQAPVTAPLSAERGESAERDRRAALAAARRESEEWLLSVRDPADGPPEEEPEQASRADSEARRRAEEMMAAPAPEQRHTSAAADPARTGEDGEEEETAAADRERTGEQAEPDRASLRRLRGRVQGVRVARRLEQERADRAGERMQAAPPAPRVRGAGTPAGPEEAAAQERPAPARRPHAAPWELPERGAPSGTGERAGAGKGTGESGAEPGAAEDGSADSGKRRLEALDRHLAQVDTPAPPAPRFAEADGPGAARRNSSGWFTEARGTEPARPGQAGTPQRPEKARKAEEEKKAKPGLQLDHGTGDQESFAATLPAPADRGGAGQEPAAERKSEYELDHGTGEHESFADTAAPDAAAQPPAARAEAAGTPAPAEPAAQAEPPGAGPGKSEYELDHGTGEHESFSSALPGTGPDATADREADADAAPRREDGPKTGPESGNAAENAAAPAAQAPDSRPGGRTGGQRDDARPSTAEATAEAAAGTDGTAAEAVPSAASDQAPTGAEASARPDGGPRGAAGPGPVAEPDASRAPAAPAEAGAAESAPAAPQRTTEAEAAGEERPDRDETGGAVETGASPARQAEAPAAASAHPGPESGPAAEKTEAASEEAGGSAPAAGTTGAEEARSDRAEPAPEASGERPTGTARPATEGTAETSAEKPADGRPEAPAVPGTGAPDTAAAAERPEPEPSAPPAKSGYELDHGTGEHESFVATAAPEREVQAPDEFASETRGESAAPAGQGRAAEQAASAAFARAAEVPSGSAEPAGGDTAERAAESAAPAAGARPAGQAASTAPERKAEAPAAEASAGRAETAASGPAEKAAESAAPAADARPEPARPAAEAPAALPAEQAPAAGRRSAPAAPERGAEPKRTTAEDLAAAEEAAFRARQSRLGRTAERPDRDASPERPSEHGPAAPAGNGDRPARADRSVAERPAADRSEKASDGAAPPPGGEEGVFSRVAENARRLSSLFGGPDAGRAEEPRRPRKNGAEERTAPAGRAADRPAAQDPDADAKPALQLDHGTGEQDRLPRGGDRDAAGADAAPDASAPAGNGRAAAPAPAPGSPASADSGGTRGWRRLARVVTGGSAAAPKATGPQTGDVDRIRCDIGRPRRIVVLGCTGGAGQTVTALMLAHTLAAYRDERVVAVDVNPGAGGMSRRIGTRTPETLTSLLANADGIDGYQAMRRYTSSTATGLEVVSSLDDPYVQTLDDRDYASLADLLSGFYEVAVLDPAATGVARALPTADGLVLVAPASADAARSVAMTFEWLDGHGYADLRSRSVVVVNGVSRRSLTDVDEAEQVARGRCRAIVRVPWDDHITSGDLGGTEELRTSTRRAHAALAGVLMHALSPEGRPAPGRTTRTEAHR